MPASSSPADQAAADLQRAIDRTRAKRAASRQRALERPRDPRTGRFLRTKRWEALGDGFVFGFWGGVTLGVVAIAVLRAIHG